MVKSFGFDRMSWSNANPLHTSSFSNTHITLIIFSLRICSLSPKIPSSTVRSKCWWTLSQSYFSLVCMWELSSKIAGCSNFSSSLSGRCEHMAIFFPRIILYNSFLFLLNLWWFWGWGLRLGCWGFQLMGFGAGPSGFFGLGLSL